MDVDDHEAAWNGMIDMIEAGAYLLARDKQNVPVANRIVECVEMGFPVQADDPHWAMIQATATREVMLDKTKQPAGDARRQPRM